MTGNENQGAAVERIITRDTPTDNEKLIEEAAKAIFAEEQCDRHQKRNVDSITENWNSRLADADKDEYRSFARAALVVFEKVYTPTDDEREAPGIVEKVRAYAEERYRYGRSDRTVGSMRIASDLYAILGMPMVEMPNPEPPGESSDARVEAAAKAIASVQGFRYPGSLKETWDHMARAALRAAAGVR